MTNGPSSVKDPLGPSFLNLLGSHDYHFFWKDSRQEVT